MLRTIIQKCTQQHPLSFHFFLRQAYNENEASSSLLQIFPFLMLSTASLVFIPCALSSFFALSIHFFGCLPLLLVPSTCPYSATTGSLLLSILVPCACPNHVSLLFLILSLNVISCPDTFWFSRSVSCLFWTSQVDIFSAACSSLQPVSVL